MANTENTNNSVKNTGIPPYAKAIFAIVGIFMPIFLAIPFIFWGHTGNQGMQLQRINLIEARILPVGQLTIDNGQSTKGPATEQAAFDPQQTYNSVCSACHATAAIGAPVFENHDDWQKRFDEAGSLDALVKAATQGIGSMPPKGGAAITDEQFHQMVEFMLKHAKVNF